MRGRAAIPCQQKPPKVVLLGLKLAKVEKTARWIAVSGPLEPKIRAKLRLNMAKLDSQAADSQIESVCAIIGYAIQDSQLRFTHPGHLARSSTAGPD
jgi:hypothetical protein